MNRPYRGLAALLALAGAMLLGLGASPLPAVAELILSCDFDDQPLDQPIGAGGAAGQLMSSRWGAIAMAPAALACLVGGLGYYRWRTVRRRSPSDD